ncbi:MAG: MFS transporter [Nitrososphaerota archaeon]|nr:MFS transporter [Candidatus Calditenuaceae archaeon]MDW8073020.1 MFS transporter [Nitrososphaerota archaeon]
MASRTMHTVPLICLGFTTATSLHFTIFGAALPLIVSELKLDYGFVGYLVGAWIFVAALAPLMFGRVLDKLNPINNVKLILVLASFSSILMAYSHDLITLNVARIIISFLFPFVWPISSKLVALYTSSQRYGYSTAVYNAGSLIGLAMSYVLMALSNYDWRLASLIAGLSSLFYIPILLAVWKFTIQYSPEIRVRASWKVQTGETDDQQALFKAYMRMAILLALAHFCAIYTWHLLLTWLSTFLVGELSFSYTDIAVYFSSITLISCVLEIFAGVYSDRVKRQRGRLLILFLGLLPSGLLLYLSVEYIASPTTALLFISLATLAWRISSPSFWSIINDIIPANYLGRVSYIYVSGAPLSGIASSIITGNIISATGSVRIAVFISSIFTILSPVIYFIAARIGYGLKSRVRFAPTALGQPKPFS